MTRLLIICPDQTGPRMAGTAIRSVEIARALAGDVEITLAVPGGSTPVAGDFAQVQDDPFAVGGGAVFNDQQVGCREGHHWNHRGPCGA